MRIAVMQPYFYPHVGYFGLIANVDLFVVFDTAQYVRRSWINRNRVLHPNAGWKWLTVPTKRAPRETPIGAIRTAPEFSWPIDLIKGLDHYRGSAPHFDVVMESLEDVNAAGHRLAKLNVATVAATCELLNIEFNHVSASDIDSPCSRNLTAAERIIRVCRHFGAAEYLNTAGGRALYDADKFAEHGIRLKFLDHRVMTYPTGRFEFEPGLSILDTLMWCSPSTVKQALAMNCDVS